MNKPGEGLLLVRVSDKVKSSKGPLARAMKPLTVQLSDDVYERAERLAADRGATLPGEVAELIKRYSEGNGQDAANGHREIVPQMESPNIGVAEVLQELDTVADECRLVNWDGQGAAPVGQDTLGHARRLLECLPNGYPMPSVGVEPDGHVTLEWYRSPNWTLSVSISPESDLYYAALFGTNDVRGREVFSGKAPEIILSLIRRVHAA